MSGPLTRRLRVTLPQRDYQYRNVVPRPGNRNTTFSSTIGYRTDFRIIMNHTDFGAPSAVLASPGTKAASQALILMA